MMLADLPTPALVVDVGRLDANLDAMAAALGAAGVALRPHWKTTKCLEVARRQLERGAVGFTCATPAEVEALAGVGITGSLWAHLPVGEAKVAFAVRAARDWGTILMVDSVAVARPLSAALEALGVDATVRLEVDTGQGRTGVNRDEAVAVAREVAALPRITLEGVMTHEGHLAAHGGDRTALEVEGRAVSARLVAVADELRAAGVPLTTVSVGSTPGVSTAPFGPGITEARPGTYAYFDANQLRLGSCTLEQCATTVLATVVSRNRPGSAIIDAGTKAMSSDSLTPEVGAGLVLGVDGGTLPDITFATANEEHGFLVGAGAEALAVGDRVRIVPNHACGTTNMWSGVWALDGADVTRWEITARH